MKKISVDYIKDQIVGNDSVFETPFGRRNLFYSDYTASGRNLKFIEEKLLNIEKSYANTHTTDDYSGEYLTELLHGAEKKIKELVNAGDDYKIISAGSGSTGALKRLQEILGIYIPPHTKDRIFSSIKSLGCQDCSILEKIKIDRPVVFIGPYEHHTNELMWREAFADIVVIDMNDEGEIDKEMLIRELKKDKYTDKVKYCSFSAGSNITGILTDIFELARIAHAHGAYIFYDFAAIAPYAEINMMKDEISYFDAIFFSPHKFLGGPGSSGVLIFNKKLYRSDLPPTTAGGGTVDFVGFKGQDYSKDIETREKAGTPPILQTIKTAFALELKNKAGIKNIKKLEDRNKKLFFDHFTNSDKIEIIGNKDPHKRIGIVSFNIKHLDKYLHPRLVTRLLSDLFGIQSRAGCSCAGPYGHRLLHISNEMSLKYRKIVVGQGMTGVKPGWVRVNLHWIFGEDDVEFIIDAIEFIAEYGERFLKLYGFDPITSEWRHIDHENKSCEFSIDDDFDTGKISLKDIDDLRKEYFTTAKNIAGKISMPSKKDFLKYDRKIEELKNFYHCIEIKRRDK
ncbi:MAG: aminotransferase class V-fold PLP-dependent enzyme [Candidatus Delongbacteria bacterium]|jgi:selenocysteine lyase/cysteine desulfurase|nr:aminotransferase class V-fold PLP-dependent enzyme [Candidatus Delongbacteria bacterium]